MTTQVTNLERQVKFDSRVRSAATLTPRRLYNAHQDISAYVVVFPQISKSAKSTNQAAQSASASAQPCVQRTLPSYAYRARRNWGEPAKILPYWIGNLILAPRFNLIRQGLTEPSVAPGVAALAEAQVPEAFATDFHHSSQHCYESGQSVRATDHFSVKWNALYRSGTLDEVRFTCSHATEMVNLHSSTSTLLDVSLIANDPCPSNLFNASCTAIGQVSLVRQSTDTIDLRFVTAANLFG